MQFRKLKQEEMNDLKKLQSIVYFMKYDEAADDSQKDKNRWKFARGAFTEEGKLAAILEIVAFKSFLDGTSVGSAGIAGVATLLEHRRGGAVKKLLQNAFEEINENGDVMSYLYPFSHEYYRKYGYAQGAYADTIKADIAQFLEFDTNGYTRQYFQGEGFGDLKTIYNKFSQNYNCCIKRDDRLWEKYYSDNPLTDRKRVFIRYNSLKEPIAYIKLEAKEISENKFDMNVIEAAWVGNEGVLGLLAIIRGYKGDMRNIVMDVPAGFPVEILIKEAWKLEVNRKYTGMNRIINAKKALEIMKKPEEAGRVVVSLVDEHAPWNTGNWLVEWEQGQSRVQETDKEGDIICNAPSFSQLVTGYMAFNDIKLKADVDINGNEDILGSLFIKKPCFIWDKF